MATTYDEVMGDVTNLMDWLQGEKEEDWPTHGSADQTQAQAQQAPSVPAPAPAHEQLPDPEPAQKRRRRTIPQNSAPAETSDLFAEPVETSNHFAGPSTAAPPPIE